MQDERQKNDSVQNSKWHWLVSRQNQLSGREMERQLAMGEVRSHAIVYSFTLQWRCENKLGHSFEQAKCSTHCILIPLMESWMFQTYMNYEFSFCGVILPNYFPLCVPLAIWSLSKLSGEVAVSWKATLFKHNCSCIRLCCIFWSLTEWFFLHQSISGGWWKISVLKMVYLVHFLSSVSLQPSVVV